MLLRVTPWVMSIRPFYDNDMFLAIVERIDIRLICSIRCRKKAGHVVVPRPYTVMNVAFLEVVIQTERQVVAV